MSKLRVDTCCCDLLSNLYFCIRSNTEPGEKEQKVAVVICFQICIFVLGQTPKGFIFQTLTLL